MVFENSRSTRGIAAKHGQFEAIFVIEMNVQGRDLQFMVRVMGVCQPLRQFACVVVKHVGKRRDTFPGHAVMQVRLPETLAREIAESLRPVIVMIGGHEYGQFGRELIRHADRDSLHAAGSRVRYDLFKGLSHTRRSQGTKWCVGPSGAEPRCVVGAVASVLARSAT